MAENLSIPIITVCSDASAATTLIRSAEKKGWTIHVIETTWRGFGTKLIETYNYLKEHPEIEEFVFCDAYDVVCFGNEEEFVMKKGLLDLPLYDGLIISAERGLWPSDLEEHRDKYLKTQNRYDYINSGLYYAKSSEFIKVFELYPPDYSTDDQRWFHQLYLNKNIPMRIDSDCILFQSYSFIDEGEYSYIGRPCNDKTETYAPFYHGNGKTNMDKIIELL